MASRASQSETAILGGLSIAPMTGYALREAIRDSLGHFWSESFGQIYPALADLEQHGYVERRDSGRIGASTFAITPTGEARLRELLAQPIQRLPPRNGLLLRVFFGRHLPAERYRALIRDAKAEAEQQLARYTAIREEILTDEEHAQDRPYWLLTVSAGEHASRAAIDWANEAFATLDAISPFDVGSAPTQEGETA